jgi:hypothetical protein
MAGEVKTALAVRALAAAIAAIAACVVFAAPASARWFGSTMAGPANANYGCESALVNAPLGGTELAPTNQTSCTYRHAGYLYSNRPTFVAPGNGKITKIRVKSGVNPALLRLTVLTGSSRVDTFTGQEIPGTYTCCTARYIGPAFKPKANAITTRRVHVKVKDVRSKNINYRIHSTDGLALSATTPGTLPLSIGPNPGGFDAGTPITVGFWPRTAKGDPRVDGYSMTGLDLLFQWNFKRRR